ncbi:ABC transporter permease subunit, partial [Citrobacter sp. TBCS-14]
LSGQPLQWIISGFLTTLWVTLAGVVLATVFAIFLLSLRLIGQRFATTMVNVWVSVFRNTPLLVQLMFW